MLYMCSLVFQLTISAVDLQILKNMEPKTNNGILLLFLFWCTVFLNSAQPICVPRNRSQLVWKSEEFPPPSSAPTVSTNIEVGGGQNEKVTDPEVTSLCGITENATLCLELVAPYFNGKTDIMSVVGMMINGSMDHVNQAIATADKMMTSDPKFQNAKSKAGFADCKEMYDDALDDLQEAANAIVEKDVGTLQTMLSATISDFSTCDDGFTGQPNPIPDGVSPMADINQHLMNISAVMLSLATTIP